MFVRWKVSLRKNGGKTQYAVLVKCVRENGKPRQRVVKYLGSVRQGRIPTTAQRSIFWRGVDARIAGLDLDETTLNAVEAALSARVMRPTATELNELLATWKR